MNRKAMLKLIEWKNKTDRRPLIIHGARQVGKTYLINEFGAQNYKNTIYINLETNLRIASFFEEDISPQRIIKYLESSFNIEIVPGQTLIVFDEIQACERALTSLKYFYELTPEYHIIAAGSLLGVAINREKYSFPVGKVDSLTLYPLDFEEFLGANNREKLCGEIRSCFLNDSKMPTALHSELLELYKLYLIIGGMPRVVLEYVNTGKLINIVNIQNEILDNYISDMAKYASNADSVKIRACYNSIPNQLAKDNKKFQYKVVQAGGNATIFGAAIEWLNFAGVVQKCQKIIQGVMPIAVYSDLSSFKLYMSDVGMLTMISGLAHSTILSNLEIDNTFIGALAENYVAVALATNGYRLYYWQSENSAEIDFIIQEDEFVIPIEVKAGKRTKSRSLAVYREKYNPKMSIRISAKNFGFENGIKSVPVYAVFCIEDKRSQ
jgi:predicted AAA+ superfamily ATPase